MKRVLTALIICMLSISLCACASDKPDDVISGKKESQNSQNVTPKDEPTSAPTNTPTEAPEINNGDREWKGEAPSLNDNWIAYFMEVGGRYLVCVSHTRWSGSDYFEVSYGESNRQLKQEDIDTYDIANRIVKMRFASVSKLNEIGYLTSYDGQGNGDYAGEISINLKGSTLVFGVKPLGKTEMTYHDCVVTKLNYK